MKKRYISLALLIVLFLTNIAYCSNNKIYIFFGNGVWNDVEDIRSSRQGLKYALKSHIRGTGLEELIQVTVSYNPSEGKIKDLLETFQQNMQTDWSQFWHYLSGLAPMPDFIQDKIKEIASEVDSDIVQSNPVVQKHIKDYDKLLCDGNKVIVVAHSQGNLFANIEYNGINSAVVEGFGIVSVGNPDSDVADGPPNIYTTLDEDIIIGSLPSALDSNFDNFFGPINSNDLTGHMFIKSYMAEGAPSQKTGVRVKPLFLSCTMPAHSEQGFSSH